MGKQMIPKYASTTLAASAAVKATPGSVRAILVNAGADAAMVQLSNDANGAGSKVLEVHAPLTGMSFLDLDELGGFSFDAKIYATVTGTTPSITIWYE